MPNQIVCPKCYNHGMTKSGWFEDKQRYKCNECGHIWKAKGIELLGGSWCDKCARRKAGDRQRHSIKVLQEFADKFEGISLAKEYIKSDWIYDWECKNGHMFSKKFSNMKHRNQFCPVCEGRILRKSLNIR